MLNYSYFALPAIQMCWAASVQGLPLLLLALLSFIALKKSLQTNIHTVKVGRHEDGGLLG